MDTDSIVPQENLPIADPKPAAPEIVVPAIPSEEIIAQPELSAAPPTALPAGEAPEAEAPVLEAQPSEPTTAPVEPAMPVKPRRRHVGLIVAIVMVVVLLLAAGGGFAYLRMSETRLLDQAAAAQTSSNWAAVQDNCAQLAALPLQNLLVDPQRCLPLTGEALFQTGKLDQALTDLQAANLRYPDLTKPYVLITQIYAQQGKTEQAMAAGAEAIKHDDTFALPYTLQAVDAFKRSQYKDAETAAQAALQRDAKQAAALRVLGTLESWRGENKALDHLNQAIALDPKDLPALAARGSFAYRQGRLKDFDTDITAILDISMEAPESLLVQAMRASLDHDLPKAYQLIGQAVQKNPEQAELYYYRALFNPTTEKGNKSILADLDKSLQINPDFYPAQADKLSLQFTCFEKVDLVAEGNRLITAVPESGAGQRLMILHYLRLRQWDQALEWANKLTELLPENAGAYNLRGRAYNGLQKYALAIADFQKAIQLYPNTVDARFGLTEAHGDDFSLDPMKYLDEAVQIAPNSPDVYVQRAVMYINNSEKDKARSDIDKALQMDPLNFEGLTMRATLNIDDSNFNMASEDIARISDLYPNAPNAHVLRGLVYLRQKPRDAQNALDEFKKTIEIMPTESWAYGLAAEASYWLKNYDQAVTYANDCLKLDPKDGTAYAWLAEIYYQKSDYEKTLENARKALVLRPGYTWLYLEMADANVALGDYATAAGNLQSALANQKNLSTDEVQQAEKELAFYKTVPPLLNGMRTFSDKAAGFSISYSTAWTPAPIPTTESYSYTMVFLTDNNEDGIRLFVEMETIDSPYANQFTAQMIADFLRQNLALQYGYKFSTRAQLNGQEFGYVDTFDSTYKYSNDTNTPVRGQIYSFYTPGKMIIITVFGPTNIFPKYKAEVEKVVTTLKFIK